MSLNKVWKAVMRAVGPEPAEPPPPDAGPPPATAPSGTDSPSEPKSSPEPLEWSTRDAAIVSHGPPASAGEIMTARCGLSLRPLDERFADTLHAWRNDMRFLHLWNSSRKPCTREEFWADMRHMQQHTNFFLIHEDGKEEPIGCVYAARPASRAQRYLQVNTVLTPENQKLGYGIAATFLFIRHLFASFDISKIVLEVYGWNAGSIKSSAHLPEVKLEGIRRNHVYWNGRAYDYYEFGVSREAFQQGVMKSAAWKRLIGTEAQSGNISSM